MTSIQLAETQVSQKSEAGEKGDSHESGLAQATRDAEIQPLATRATRTKLFFVLTGLFLCLFLSALDFTIVSPALPTISRDLHSAASYTWIGSAYLLSNAAAAPLWGKFSDIWGRKRILLIAVSVFFIGSLICALSVDVGMLIVGRAVQGSASGGIVILVNICISDIFPISERGFYLGLTGLVWTFASGVGPVIGGTFAEKVSWRWNWWINLPCCGLAFGTLFSFLNPHHTDISLKEGFKRIDWVGMISILAVTILFLLGLDFGGITFPWSSAKVLCLIIFGPATLIIFVLGELKVAKYPIMPMRLFQNRSNIGCFLVCFAHGFTYISASYFLPIYFQAVGIQSPIMSGVLVLPIAVVQSLTGIAAGYFVNKTGRYIELIWVGMTLLTLGFGLFIDFNANFSLGKCIGVEVVSGVGIGMLFNSPLIALQKNIKEEDIAAATATYGFTRNLATSVSVVLGGVIFQTGIRSQFGALHRELGLVQAQKFSGAQAGANVRLVPSLNARDMRVVQEAFAYGLRNMWIMYTAMPAIGLFASCLISRQKVHDS